MRIGSVDVPGRIAVVAEIGNNHEGDMALARELVREAAAAGAHAVKLQAIDPPRLVRATETARLAQLERFRLREEDFRELHDLARELGVGFLCTPFSLAAVEWLAPLVDAFKIASGDNDHLGLLRAVGATGKPVIISTGMSDAATIRTAKETAEAAGAAEVALLHCVSAYPAGPEDASLASIPALAREHDCVVGYSDHLLGIEGAVVAAAAGARIIEKHFTLRHDLSDFHDHRLSADPAQMRELVARVAEVERLLGSPRTGVLPAEEPVAAAARRSAVAAADLPAGHRLREADVDWLRPGDGIGPSRAGELIGRTLRRALRRGERIGEDDVA